MNKKFLSIVTAGIIGATALSTSAMASDTTDLRKATVKVIKTIKAMSSDLDGVKSQNHSLESKIEQNTILIKNLSEDNSVIKNNLRNTTSKMDNNSSLQIELDNLKSNYQGQIDVLNARIQEMNRNIASNKSESKLNSNYVSSTVSQDISTLKQEIATIKSKPSVTELKYDNTEVNSLKKENLYLKNELKALRDMVVNYKAYSDSELKVIKTKLDGAKPVYFMKDKVVQDCKQPNGKCNYNSENFDSVIKDYIKD